MSLGRRRRDRMASPGPGPYFRGKELLGLVLFVAIAAVGWPILINQFRRTQQLAEPTQPKIPLDPRPIKPDDSLPFQAIQDKTTSQFRELAAYAELLKRARETTPKQLQTDSRRDLLFTHLWERPADYRGVPVHLEGTALKVLSYEAKPELTPKKRLYEAWFITPESRQFPYVVVFEEPPPGLTLGDNKNEPIVVDAYFFKLLGYRAGDVPRAAPMLIGRARLPQAGDKGTGAVAARTRPLWRNTAFIAIGTLLLYLSIRVFLLLRKFFAPRASTHSSPESDHTYRPDVEPPSEQAVADFLQNLETSPEPPTADNKD